VQLKTSITRQTNSENSGWHQNLRADESLNITLVKSDK